MPRRTVHDDPATSRHTQEIAQLARPLERSADLDPLLARIGERRHVLLGEASHGTSEYYRWRAEITRRLITERGLSFVAVEGDWPDCMMINRWVKGIDDGSDAAADMLAGFERWPTWMWANREVAAFLDWLRAHNAALPMAERVGFYGLDVYSLWESMEAIMGYLGDNQPDALQAAHAAYRCFEPYDEDPHRYAYATRLVPTTCEDEVVDLLRTMRQAAPVGNGDTADERFDAQQNAEIAVNAERYYRAMINGSGSSWNIRDTHMADTLDRLMAHHGPNARAAVWEHNTHIGDARATPMGRAGMVNIGQLMRERHGDDDVVLVGFGCHEGSVIAADSWGGQMREVAVPPSPPGTHEDLIHGVVDDPGCLLLFDGDVARRRRIDWLQAVRGHRAIGVVYDAERAGNWVPTVIGSRYDAFLFFGNTRALQPLHLEPVPSSAEYETYPFNE
jgi:erythromycin esterase